MKRHSVWILAGIAAVAVGAAACGGGQPADQATEKQAKVEYPGPRFPSYLQPPTSIDEIMPHVRPIVRSRSGLQGAGLGVLEEGETVLLVASGEADDLILEAVKKGLEERGVNVILKRDYEMVGVSREEFQEYYKARRSYTSEQGYMEAANWVDLQFPDPAAAKAWFREKRPDLADKIFPQSRELTPKLKVIYEKYRGESMGTAIREFLEKNPKVRGVFWGKGGSTSLRRYLRPAEDKFLGLMLIDNRYDVMSQLGVYPGDLHQLAEDQTMEPLVHVDRIEVKDPEGTDLNADITEEMALNWSRGVYQRGHLYMFPNQATGRFGYSVVDYPAFQGEWLPREPLALANGVIAGTTNHTGYYPRWEVTVKDGYIRDVKGGGLFGEALKTFLQYPNINEQVLPFHNENHPGYWWLYEIGLGTHPKAFRNPALLEQGTATPERNRSGVIHWGLGVTLHHDPGSPQKSQKLIDFTEKWNLPRDHGWHTHTYFNTYRVHLRNANRWVVLIDNGRLTSLDHPEVRALASRYGDPEALLAEDWRPNMPGINMPGDYLTTYAVDPWKYIKEALDQVDAGTYPGFYPPRSAPAATKAGGGN